MPSAFSAPPTNLKSAPSPSIPHEDRLSLHRFKADEAYLIGEGKGPVQAYLDVEGIVALAKERGVDAIHPGYGFLSENPALPRACDEAGITFIGPSADLLDLLGDKTAARRLAQSAGLPVVPGTEEPVTQKDDAQRIADKIGYPLIVKAAFGGGGRGMRVVQSSQLLLPLLQEARARGGRVLWQRRGISGALHSPRAAHRSANPGRSCTGTFCTCMSAIAPCSAEIRRSWKSLRP